MEINIYVILIWITAILIGSFDIVVFLGSKSRSSRVFATFSFILAIWAFSYGYKLTSIGTFIPFLLIKLEHLLGIYISLGFYYFSLVYPNDTKPRSSISVLLFVIGLIFTILFLFTDLMIPGMIAISGPDHWGWQIGKLQFLYVLAFIGLWITALNNIWHQRKSIQNLNTKTNLLFMFWGLTLGIIPPIILNILLPLFGYYEISWLSPIASLIWISIIGYSIIHYRQMNIRAVITEVLAIAMSVILFINIFVDISSDTSMSIVTFLAFITLAFYLIRLTLQEARQKEMLRQLNENLESRVAEQTIEIRRAFELEKKAHRDLEKLNETKNQFIMITQHHLRAPVNNIKAGLDEIYKNGKDASKKFDVVNDMKKATNRLSRIVDDFLAITALKAGGQLLDIKTVNMKPVIEDILQELHLDIENAHITVNYPRDPTDWPELQIDESKIRDAFLIIIENAVKYNIPYGKINIDTAIHDMKNSPTIRTADDNSSTDGKILQITIENTGVGIAAKDKESIFNHLFYRTDIAKKANPTGMGIGLSVARAIIRAHHGELTIESDGVGKGARVEVEFILE